ncbi:SDR family oxidoreductase [Gordonia sp. TBRC 11910]|uniref:SDR family oxidoreductase n=1 Tax=Gordonia asplenii TaxID=2725283 RepID=A0A848L0I0_9ACTN|nr:SDR family NAD(P)-dependent oxidoreductase [Gordonia asplenii]NMO01991.1 SDR family oxidoreductase [Gordonia asplenii]
MNDFTGKVAMITGAGRGIGAATARVFADAGAAVAICDVLDDDAEETAAAIRRGGGAAISIHTDVSDGRSVQSAVAHVLEKYGRLDFAHNNAGTFSPAPLADVSEEDFRKVIAVNLTGVFLCMKYQIPHLVETSGAIVNTASVWSMAGAPNQSAYSASKHGVVGLTRTAAIDYGERGIRVNAVAPGPIATAMTASVPTEIMESVVSRTTLSRYGQPDEIGKVVAWLCSSEASYLNGAVVPVDGGWLAA